MDTSRDFTPSAPKPKQTRRKHSAEFKARVLAEIAAGEISVAAAGLRHNINANLIHKWRRQAETDGARVTKPSFLPVIATKPTDSSQETTTVKVELPLGAGTATLHWPTDQTASLATFLQALS